MRDLLAKIRDVANPARPVDQAGHPVSPALRRVNDRSSIMVGDAMESKRNAMARQDMSDGDAARGPEKLNQCEHGAYMSEAK